MKSDRKRFFPADIDFQPDSHLNIDFIVTRKPIDAQTRLTFAAVSQPVALTSDIGFINFAAVKAASDKLVRGIISDRGIRPLVRGFIDSHRLKFRAT